MKTKQLLTRLFDLKNAIMELKVTVNIMLPNNYYMIIEREEKSVFDVIECLSAGCLVEVYVGDEDEKEELKILMLDISNKETLNKLTFLNYFDELSLLADEYNDSCVGIYDDKYAEENDLPYNLREENAYDRRLSFGEEDYNDWE